MPKQACLPAGALNTDDPLTLKHAVIIPETGDWQQKIENLLDLSFGPTRSKRAIYRLRSHVAALKKLCFLIHGPDGQLYASLRFWPLLLPDNHQALLFGPLAVHPDIKGIGIGKKLIQYGLNQAKKTGAGGVVISGLLDYYKRFGFQQSCVLGLKIEGDIAPFHLMGIEWKNQFLARQKGSLRAWKPTN